MDQGFPTETAEGAGASTPSESWRFAQDLLGNAVPSASSAAADERAKREQLAWLAKISPKHESQLRGLLREQVDMKTRRAQLEWLANISPRHERQLRRLLAAEAETREVQGRFEWLVEGSTLQEVDWDPAKHARRGGPPNAGWFATTGGAGSASSTPKKQTATSSTPADTPPPPATKPQLPAEHRGTWISGTKGDGVFRYNGAIENQRAGLVGKEVRFENQHIAVGGLPAATYHGGDAAAATVEIPKVTGLDADNLAADAAMRKKLGNPKWRRPEGYVWNHAGQPGSKSMELVEAKVHKATAHKGPAAEPRALRRAAGARGATGRAMGALTVYLTARDAVQAAGALQPDFEVTERETYHYVSEDGSVFVMWPAGLFSSAKREFVAGPRKGQTEKITNAQAEVYRKQAEEEWGKYIPGTLFSQPRFIPGKKRKSLPLMERRHGVPYKAGWIDEDGVHRHPASNVAII